MNEVAKWLWYTDIVGSFHIILQCLLVVTIFSMISSFLIYHHPDTREKIINPLKIICLASLIFTIFFTFIIMVIPSQRTMLFITASKATQQAMATQEGQKALQVLDKKLDEYLKDDK